ncbi:hypothetical protein FB107DRAFT_292857 [Schizophyllum commune]
MSVGTDDLEVLQAESDILSAKARSCYAPAPAEAATIARRVHDWQAIDAQLEHEIAALTLRRQVLSTQKLFNKTLLSPWRRLPVELWIEVFTYALPSNWAEAYAGGRRLYMAQMERIPVDVSLVLDIDMTDESSMSDVAVGAVLSCRNALRIRAPDLRALTMIGDIDPPSEPNSTFKAYVDLLKRSPEVLELESLALLDVVVVADEFAQTLRRMPSLTSLEVSVYSTDCYDSPAPLNRLTTLLQRPHDPHPTDLLPSLTCLVIGYRRPKVGYRLRVLAITRRPLFVAHTTGFATLTTFGKSYENVPDELTIDAIRNRTIQPFYIRGW